MTDTKSITLSPCQFCASARKAVRLAEASVAEARRQRDDLRAQLATARRHRETAFGIARHWREMWRKDASNLAAMRPVVEAAVKWQSSWLHPDSPLIEAVQHYRVHAPGCRPAAALRRAKGVER